MGRTLANKKEIVADLKETLSEAQLAFVINYEGLSVAEITELRNRLRPSGATCKIAKNTLMNIAIDGDANWQPMEGLLSDATAFLFTGEEIGAAVKAYKGFQKETKKTELRGGVMEGQALSKTQVEALGDLPTKDELYAQIAGTINALATKIAVGVKEVPSGLARGIKAVSEKAE
ncbi:50S ribosomal protein L10 [Waterburya agarophytonicola K14]|uniref:Large ribosomal subunit protein uL10 n=1 Tax=Waterburya agarophytonicola KI4 TaxID=2874699 RepID=A0A964FDK1_9CYAN|nr:50S ribosomal protein L10 [Waterburya agarophytonicola]MCC0175675.1 50S ribosomal protein L10 [Waterburya agarophytonicola KI4]